MSLIKEAERLLKDYPYLSYKEIIVYLEESKGDYLLNEKLGYEYSLMETRKRLLEARNHWNNCIEDDLIDILVNEINALEQKENYLIRKLKEGAV